jgi:hypothetical protein
MKKITLSNKERDFLLVELSYFIDKEYSFETREDTQKREIAREIKRKL